MEQVSKFIDKLIDDRRKTKLTGPWVTRTHLDQRPLDAMSPVCGSYWSDWDQTQIHALAKGWIY